MKRKSLYALAILLFLSSVAFSKERVGFHCRTAGAATCVSTCVQQAADDQYPLGPADHVLLHTFIRLLYI